MRSLFLGLILRQLGATLAVAAAAAALVSVAALVEGHAPRPATLAAVVPPVAALAGAAWTLAAWRAEGGDVALANLGVPPHRMALVLALVAAPALWVTGAPAGGEPTAQLTLAPGRLVASGPGLAPVSVRWSNEGAQRDDTGERFPGLPAPTTAPDPPPAAAPGWPAPARCGLLALLLLWLAHRADPPGLTPVLAGVALTFAAGHGLALL